jgi:serine/threonine-protein kinase RsbW/stage II sporulation protein AB (anti-sigma F factor)
MGTREDKTGGQGQVASKAGRLDVTVHAIPERIGELRQAARAFAELHGVDRLDDVALAVTEACANVIAHAYVDRTPGPLRLTAAHEDAGVSFLVTDDGSGLAPRPDSPGLGLGLPLIAQLADQFELSDNGGRGTRVRMRFDIAHAPAPRRPGTGGTSRRAVTERE